MVYIQALIQKTKEEFQGKTVDQDDFINILNRIGEINEKYKLEEEVQKQLYQVLYEKQGGQVNIEGIEALILQCLLEEQSQLEQKDKQNFDVDQLEIKSMNHIKMGEEKIVSTYRNMTLDSISQLLVIYNKAVNSNKQQDKEKCELSFIIQQVENLKNKGNLQLEKDQAVEIFTMLSCRIQGDETFYVFNNDLQQYISKFENYLLLNKYGQYNVENYEQAFVFHESEEECTNDDSSKSSISDLDQKESLKQESPQMFIDQIKDSQERQTNFFDSTLQNKQSQRSSICTMNQMSSLLYLDRQKSSNNNIIENSIVSSMRELYPLLADLIARDESLKGIVEKIEVFYSQLQQELQILSHQTEEKDSQIQNYNQQNQLKNQLISELEKKQEDYIKMNHNLEERIIRLQEKIDKKDQQIQSLESRESEFFSLQKEFEKLSKSCKDKEKEINSFKSLVTDQKQAIIEKQTTIDTQERYLEKLKNESDTNRQEIAQESIASSEKQQADQLLKAIKYQEEENDRLKYENEQLLNQMQNYIRIIQDKEESIDILNKEIMSLKKQIEEINESLINSHQDFVIQSKENFFTNLLNSGDKRLSLKKSLQDEAILFDTFQNEDYLHLEPQPSIQQDVEKYLSEQQQVKQGIDSIQNNLAIVIKSDDQINEPEQQNFQSPCCNIISPIGNQKYFGDENTLHLNSKSDIKMLPKLEAENVDQQNLKKMNCFSFAALEIIQTSRNILSKQNIQENEGLQSLQKLLLPTFKSVSRSLSKSEDCINNNENSGSNDNPSENQQVSYNSQVHLKDAQLLESPSATNNQIENTLESKKPSFQQVLKGDANYYWNQLNKQLYSSNPSSFYKSPQDSSSQLFQEKRNLVVINEFSVIQEESASNTPSNRESIAYLQKQHSASQNFSYQLTSTDYLNLRQDARIIDLRIQFEKYNPNLQESSQCTNNLTPTSNPQSNLFYSDSIYRINAQNEKERRIFCITSQFVYIINPMENFKVNRKFKVGLINRITFSNTNSNLCVIHVLNQAEYVIETCRRFDLNIFLSNLFKTYLQLPIYMISFADNLMIRSKKKQGKKIFNSPQQKKNTFQELQILSESNEKKKRLSDCNDYKSIKAGNTSFSLNVNKIDKTEKIQPQESQLYSVQLKIHQNYLKSLFMKPWKSFYLKMIDSKVVIYKDQSAINKEMEFYLKDITVQEEMNCKEKLESNEIKLIDQEDNFIYIKTNNQSDYEQCLQTFKKGMKK